jgi:hypothetical protein
LEAPSETWLWWALHGSGLTEFRGHTKESLLERYAFRRRRDLEFHNFSEIWEWIDRRYLYIDHSPCWVTGEPQEVAIWNRTRIRAKGFRSGTRHDGDQEKDA